MQDFRIFVPKIDEQHNDSIWYDGLIAEKGEYSLVAAGDVRIYKNDKDGKYLGMYDGKARDDFTAPDNDYDLEPMYNNENGYVMDMNNWFEILDANGEGVADVYGNYDEAIDALAKMGTA